MDEKFKGLTTYLTLLRNLKEKGVASYDLNGNCDINKVINVNINLFIINIILSFL